MRKLIEQLDELSDKLERELERELKSMEFKMNMNRLDPVCVCVACQSRVRKPEIPGTESLTMCDDCIEEGLKFRTEVDIETEAYELQGDEVPDIVKVERRRVSRVD